MPRKDSDTHSGQRQLGIMSEYGSGSVSRTLEAFPPAAGGCERAWRPQRLWWEGHSLNHSNSTMVDERPPARGRSRPRRLGAPPARRDRADRLPLRDCAARDASLEHVLRDDHACDSLRYQRGRGPRQVQRNRAHVRKPRRWPAPLRYEAFTVHCAGAGRTKPTLKIDSWSPSARGWLDRNGS